jgi:hypothetical protein
MSKELGALSTGPMKIHLQNQSKILTVPPIKRSKTPRIHAVYNVTKPISMIIRCHAKFLYAELARLSEKSWTLVSKKRKMKNGKLIIKTSLDPWLMGIQWAVREHGHTSPFPNEVTTKRPWSIMTRGSWSYLHQIKRHTCKFRYEQLHFIVQANVLLLVLGQRRHHCKWLRIRHTGSGWFGGTGSSRRAAERPRSLNSYS